MKGFAENLKSIIIIFLVVSLALLSSLRLMRIQVVGDNAIETPQQYEPGTLTYKKGIKATRGEIIDFSGNTIVTNDARTDIVLQMAFFPTDFKEGNKILLGIYRALEEHGYKFKESIPVSFSKPYIFLKEDNSELISDLNLNVYATAENCIDKLISDYEIADTYTDEEKRIIAGMRYQMIDKDFSYSNDLLLAEGVDEKTVVDLKELGNFKEHREEYFKLFQGSGKPLVVVINKYNSTYSSIKEVANWMGIKKPNGWVVLHDNPYITWATNHGKLNTLFNNIERKDTRVIELQSDLFKICTTLAKGKSTFTNTKSGGGRK